MSDAALPRFDADGLVPVIVQDETTRRVLMLGYMDEEAYRLTRERGTVHFWSRSRRRIWEKGETSGNRLHCSSLALDCDDDALLALVHPAGPTCHTGSATCWDDGPLGAGFASLETLWTTIRDRIERRPEGSYTARLADGGPDLPARKLVEEATEVLMAAKDHALGAADDRRLAEEVADTIYHLLVVCAERSLDPALVLDVLAERAS